VTVAVDETLAQASNVLVYSAMAVYTGAFGAFAVDLSGRGRAAATPARTAVPAVAGASGPGAASSGPVAVADRAPAPVQRRKAAGVGVSLTALAFLLHLGAVLTRGLSAHRAPWGNMYEFSVSGAVVVTGVYLLVLSRRDARFLGTFVIGPVLLTLGLAVAVLYTRSAALVPALNSYWLFIHVTVAFAASALFTIAFSVTVLQLVQQRRELARPRPRRGRFMDGLPASAELERLGYRLHVVAFPLWTFTLIAGAIWAERSWGRYWNWDPKEVWTFVIWTVYAGYLHARATRGWDGRRAAYLALAGFGCVLFNFLVVNILFPGLHAYSGVG
jgi:cytochrome c-type biogenesis protein CcsB